MPRSAWVSLVAVGMLLSLSGCVTGQKVDVPPSYKLGSVAPENTREGVVAFSLKLNIDEIGCDDALRFARCRSGIYVLRKDGPHEDGRDGLNAVNPFQMDATEEGLYGPATYIAGPLQPRKDMIIWKLPAGYYRVWSWYVSFASGSISPRDYPELYDFSVAADEVTYLGRLDLRLDIEDRSNMTFESEIRDLGDEEHPKIMEAFPQFSGKVKTQLFETVRMN